MDFAKLLLITTLVAIVRCSNSSHLRNYNAFNFAPSCRESKGSGKVIEPIQPQPFFGDPFPVLCDNDYRGGGWVVIQQRFNGAVDFYRGWKDFEDGFGNIQGEFWLGLKKIHELTYSNKYELNVLLEDWDGFKVEAKYSHFLVAGPEEKYKLRSLGQYSGTAGDSLAFSLNMPFSTLDQENDPDPKQNCAQKYAGAWWHKNCHESNLNGLYVRGLVPDFATMMCWKAFRGHYYGLKVSRMLIREIA